MRSRKTIVFAMLVVAIVASMLSAAVAAQLEPAPTNPALFDLELAESQLDTIERDIERIRAELDDVLDDVDGLTIERDFIELNNKERNDIMQQARTRARTMAINAYIGIGPPISGVVVLDAESANDLSYRSSLLRQQAQRLQEAAETYAVLAGEVDDNVLALGDSINDQLRLAESLSRALTRETDKLPDAEWIVTIAEIHALANESFEDSGRAEPTAEQWRELRFCESTETYKVDSGNTFYGAYQFTWETWGTVYGDGNPAHAPPAEQDARARLLYARRGSQPWPVCGRFLP